VIEGVEEARAAGSERLDQLFVTGLEAPGASAKFSCRGHGCCSSCDFGSMSWPTRHIRQADLRTNSNHGGERGLLWWKGTADHATDEKRIGCGEHL
jgi:hypothetical protein